MRRKAPNGFVDKEEHVLIAVAEKIGSTLGHVAALGQVAKKAGRATVRPVRRRGLKRTVRTNSTSKITRVRRSARSKTRSARRRK
jgi:hypothetical protein